MHSTRLKVLIAFTIALIFGLPIWWHTTKVPRASLPHAAIADAFDSKQYRNPIRIAVNIVLALAGTDSTDKNKNCQFDANQLSADINNNNNNNNRNDTNQVNIVFDITASKSNLAITATHDYDIDELLHNQLIKSTTTTKSSSTSSSYTIFVLDKKEIVAPTWGKYRHGFFSVSECSYNAVSSNVKLLLNELIPKTAHGSATRRVPMKSSARYVLAFTLLSADSSSAVVDWNIPSCRRAMLEPFLQKISHVASFSIESQVRHNTPLLSKPSEKTPGNEYVLDAATLQRVVDPNAWQLDNIDANATTIQLVVFIPPASVPLRLRESNGELSNSNSFVVPQWGGVIVRNLDWIQIQTISDTNAPIKMQLTCEQLTREMARFVEHIKALLGLPTRAPNAAVHVVHSSHSITDWEVDTIIRAHMFENLRTATETIHSLSLLVASMKTMTVLDRIKILLERSLNSMESAYRAIDSGQLDNALAHSQVAVVAAETAFFDRNMLAMLYYPDEHNLAIYLSFFLPISLPFFSSFWNEYKRRRDERKKAAEEASKKKSQ